MTNDHCKIQYQQKVLSMMEITTSKSHKCDFIHICCSLGSGPGVPFNLLHETDTNNILDVDSETFHEFLSSLNSRGTKRKAISDDQTGHRQTTCITDSRQEFSESFESRTNQQIEASCIAPYSLNKAAETIASIPSDSTTSTHPPSGITSRCEAVAGVPVFVNAEVSWREMVPMLEDEQKAYLKSGKGGVTEEFRKVVADGTHWIMKKFDGGGMVVVDKKDLDAYTDDAVSRLLEKVPSLPPYLTYFIGQRLLKKVPNEADRKTKITKFFVCLETLRRSYLPNHLNSAQKCLYEVVRCIDGNYDELETLINVLNKVNNSFRNYHNYYEKLLKTRQPKNVADLLAGGLPKEVADHSDPVPPRWQNLVLSHEFVTNLLVVLRRKTLPQVNLVLDACFHDTTLSAGEGSGTETSEDQMLSTLESTNIDTLIPQLEMDYL